MEGVHVNYLGRVVPIENFRTFVYGADGTQKIAKSWEDYEAQISSGVWFPTREDATKNAALDDKTKRVKKEPVKGVMLETPANAVNDCFLPKEG